MQAEALKALAEKQKAKARAAFDTRFEVPIIFQSWYPAGINVGIFCRLIADLLSGVYLCALATPVAVMTCM